MMRNIKLIKISDGWQAAAAPPEEKARIEELQRYQILDSWPTPGFTNIAELVAELLDVSISLVSLVDTDRQWFKVACGIDAQETGRDESFCAHAIWGNDLFVVPDTHQDERFRANPLVTGEPYIRFYAGAPLITPNGYRLGTLCAIDDKPRDSFSQREANILRRLSEVVVDELELHYSNIQLQILSEAKSNFFGDDEP